MLYSLFKFVTFLFLLVTSLLSGKEDMEVWTGTVPKTDSLMAEIKHWQHYIANPVAQNDYISEVVLRYSTVSYVDMCKLNRKSSEN